MTTLQNRLVGGIILDSPLYNNIPRSARLLRNGIKGVAEGGGVVAGYRMMERGNWNI